jgi:hypothetical protein
VRLLRLVLVLAAVFTTGVQLFQERRRLGLIERLPGPKAREHYEATRARDERFMLAFTAVLALAAGAAVVALVTLGRAR